MTPRRRATRTRRGEAGDFISSPFLDRDRIATGGGGFGRGRRGVLRAAKLSIHAWRIGVGWISESEALKSWALSSLPKIALKVTRLGLTFTLTFTLTPRHGYGRAVLGNPLEMHVGGLDHVEKDEGVYKRGTAFKTPATQLDGVNIVQVHGTHQTKGQSPAGSSTPRPPPPPLSLSPTRPPTPRRTRRQASRLSPS